MKNLTILIFILISFKFSFSQDRSLGGFENIRWGDSKDIAKVKILKIDRIKYNSTAGNSMRLENGIYLNEKVGSWILNFGKNGFERIVIEFQNNEDQTIKFNKIQKLLQNRYGKPADGAKSETKRSFWHFKNKNSVVLEIIGSSSLKNGTLKLSYLHFTN
jgi:hypothetical protein